MSGHGYEKGRLNLPFVGIATFGKYPYIEDWSRIAVEGALAARGARTIRLCESAPNYLTPGVDARYSAAPQFLDHAGYACIGEACNMTVALESRAFDTTGAERALAARGIAVFQTAETDPARAARAAYAWATREA